MRCNRLTGSQPPSVRHAVKYKPNFLSETPALYGVRYDSQVHKEFGSAERGKPWFQPQRSRVPAVQLC